MIYVLQLILIVLVPISMIFTALKKRNSFAKGNDKGFLFRSRNKKISNDDKRKANQFFCNLIIASELNAVIISVIFALFVFIKYGASWIMCSTLILFQLIAGFLLAYFITKIFVKRSFV